jgi:hypothetical protein
VYTCCTEDRCSTIIQLFVSVSLQRVLKDLISEKLPRFAAHLAYYNVDISLVTFNWFLCIFVDSLPVDLFLQVWDAFLFEGSKVGVVSLLFMKTISCLI